MGSMGKDWYCCCTCRIQILKIDREGMIRHGTWRHLCKKYSLTLIITNLLSHKIKHRKDVGIVTFDLIGLLPTNHIILQWHTGVYGGTFDVIVRNYSSNKQNWLKFYWWKVEMAKFRRFHTLILRLRSKIWSLPDYLGELTALMLFLLCTHKVARLNIRLI